MKRVRNYRDNHRDDNKRFKGRDKKHDKRTADSDYSANNYNNESNVLQSQKTPKRFFYITHENIAAIAQRQKELEEFNKQKFICPVCGEQINDIASSMASKQTGEPIHFECAMAALSKEERLDTNEKICYIGGGRFGVLYFPNPRDQRTFTIKKIINWEQQEHNELRQRISELYSQVE